MKAILLSLLLSAGISSHAQVDSSVAFSRMEEWLRQPGMLFRTEETTLGTLNNVTIGLITATNLDRDLPKRKVICFSYQPILIRGDQSIENTHIDEEDFSAIIQTLERMQAMMESNTVRKLQSLSYTTSNLIVFEFHNRAGNLRRWDLSIYKRYKNINKPVQGSQVRLDQEDLADLISYIKSVQKS